METALKDAVKTDASKNKKRVMLWGFGTLILGTLTFFGIKLIKKNKNNSENEIDTEKNNVLDTKNGTKTRSEHPVNSRVPHINAPVSFPIKMGAKGDHVRRLQQVLIRTYGSDILAKHGADGQFGTELESALRSRGFKILLQEADFLKITGGKKGETKISQAPKAKEPLLTFNPSIIARGIYFAIISKDFNDAINLLKIIGNTKNYSLVSEKIKAYKINGVHQTLVNALLSMFKEKSQKENIQNVFKKIGLKYDGKKWGI